MERIFELIDELRSSDDLYFEKNRDYDGGIWVCDIMLNDFGGLDENGNEIKREYECRDGIDLLVDLLTTYCDRVISGDFSTHFVFKKYYFIIDHTIENI